MSIYFDPLDKKCKSKTGAITRREEVTLSLFGVPENEECLLELNRDGEHPKRFFMESFKKGKRITLNPMKEGLYFYKFIIGGKCFGRGQERKGDFSSNESYQLLVYEEDFTTPSWFKGGVMYQIFPDRFAKVGERPIGKGKILRKDWGGMPEFRPNEKGIVQNNDFFGGNLKGIASKLDYLSSLHVTTIYLNPVFESSSNHRYDTGNYKKIDSLLGDKADFENLVKEAKLRGIRIILDGVFNHTGDDSIYFNRYGTYDDVGAYQSKQSPYYNWFNFFHYPNEYECWWGIKTLPAVNESSEDYRNYILGEEGVVRYWLQTGIGGYRLDVADELPDPFLKELRTSVKSYDPEALIIGEVWEDASNKISYGVRRQYFWGGELDSVMNYPLKNAIIDYALSGKTACLVETVKMLMDNYPKSVLDCLMNSLSTHDTARILTVLGGKQVFTKEEMSRTFLSEEERQEGIEKVKISACLQYTMPGIPCVYYGDENGMEGYGDPFCRKCFDWEHLNEDLIGFFAKLGEIRAKYRHIFAEGEYVDVYHDDHLLIFSRVSQTDRCFVYVNNSSKIYNLTFDGTFCELLQEQIFTANLQVQPYSYGILVRK
jgi:glycosidase